MRAASYLQRLVESAQRPGGSVHPLAGSLYAPSGSPLAGIFEESEERVAATRGSAGTTGRERPIEQSREVRVSPAPVPLRISEKQTAADPVPRESRVESIAFEPLVPPRPADAVEATAEARPLSPSAETRAAETRDPETIERVSYVPLLMPQAAEEPVLPARPEMRPVARAAARTAAAAPARESNDVEIHIGRIEVTAMPPAAPRQAPRRPRAGLNLGEYLARGNRRNG